VDLAVSRAFYNFEGDFTETEPPYIEYFETTAKAITNILGKPVYQGRWDAPETKEWIATLKLHADVMDLVVWEIDRVKLYLRYSWEDKEIPMLVALGAEGCQPSAMNY
jgi:hypothetical protein